MENDGRSDERTGGWKIMGKWSNGGKPAGERSMGHGEIERGYGMYLI